MADDLTLDEGTGTKKAATDEVTSNRHIPWVKLASGGDNETYGALVDSSGNLQVETTNPSIAGTAGTPNSSVLSVQGITSMTPVQTTEAKTAPNGIQWLNYGNEYTSATTGADLVAASSGLKFYVGRLTIATGYVASATTTTVTVYFGTSTYSAGTSKTLFRGEFSTIPGTGLVAYPGVVIGNGSAPFAISAATDALRYAIAGTTPCKVYFQVDYIRV